MTGAPVRLPRLLALVVLLACGDDLGPRVPAAIVVTPEVPRVPLHGTLQLDAIVVDASGHEITGEAITFRSSDAAVLTVDDAGLLTSVGTAGSSLITAASGNITAEVEAVVQLPASAIVVNPSSLELDTGEQMALSVTVTGPSGEPEPAAQVALQSSDDLILRVEELEGLILVTGLRVGTATVRLTSRERTAEVPVTVGEFPSSVDILPSSVVLPAGGSQQLTAWLLDRTGDPISPPGPVSWSTSNPSVVSIGPAGLAIAVASAGSAVITATTDTFSASIGIFVGTPPAGEILARVPLLGANGVAVTPDGRYWVSGLETFVAGALPDFGFPSQLITAGALSDIAVDTSAGRGYVVRMNGGTASGFLPGILVMDLNAHQRINSILPVSAGVPLSVGLSTDGLVLTVGTENGFVVRRLDTREDLGGTGVGSVNKITHHPSRPLLYASGAAGVHELDEQSGEIIRRFPGGLVSHAVTPDGTRLYTIGLSDGIEVWNLETGEQERRLPGVFGTDLAITPDGRFLYVIHGSNDTVDGSRLYIVDRASGALLREVVLGGLARRIAMSSDGIALITNEGPDGWVDFVR
jgi:hypothetical protein